MNTTDNGPQASQIDSLLERLGTLRETPERIPRKLIAVAARDAAEVIRSLQEELARERGLRAAETTAA